MTFLVTWLGVSAWPQVVVQLALLLVLGWLIVCEFRQAIENKWLRFILLGYVLANLVACLWIMGGTYLSWRADDFAKHFLPPYQSWQYFLNHAWIFIFEPFIFRILLSSVWVGLLWLAKKYSKSLWLDSKDIWLAALTSLAVPWPAGFVYAFLALIFMIILAIVLYIKQHDSHIRVALSLPMLISSIVCILATKFLINWLWLIGVRV